MLQSNSQLIELAAVRVLQKLLQQMQVAIARMLSTEVVWYKNRLWSQLEAAACTYHLALPGLCILHKAAQGG